MRKAETNEYKQIIAFCGKVFGKNFKKLLPKLYDGRAEFAPCHSLFHDENGVLRGVVGNFPLTLHVGDKQLLGFGIGMVSSDKRMRGKGIMTKLLTACDAEAREKGGDFMFLSGLRQRYEHFGFTPSMPYGRFVFIKQNMRGKVNDQITFERVDEGYPQMDRLIEIYNKSAFRYEREPDRFFDILRSWKAKILAIRVAGKVCGHIVVRRFGTLIDEIVTDGIGAGEVVRALFAKKRKRILFVRGSMYNREQLAELRAFAERYELCSSASIKVLNYERTIQVLLEYKAKTQKLINGILNLGIGDSNYTISVIDSIVNVDKNNKPSDCKIDALEAGYLLFGNMQEYRVVHPLFAAWFPLPLTMPHVDNV